MAWRFAGSVTTTKPHSWAFEPVGACVAISMHSRMSCAGTGRVRSRRLRTDRVVVRSLSAEARSTVTAPRLRGFEAVLALKDGDPRAVGGVPALAAEALRALVHGDRLPRQRISLGGPVAHGDPEPVRSSGRLDAEVAALRPGEPVHLHGHRAVTGL